MDEFAELRKEVVSGNMERVVAVIQDLIEKKTDAKLILDMGLIPAMNEVGDKMGRREIFIPEVLLAARAMEAALKIVRPTLLKQGDFRTKGTVVLGTVKGDIHDIGKNLVRYVLEGGGFTVIDLGVDVPPEKFARSISEHNPNIIGMSAMLTTTMKEMENTIRFLEHEGYRNKVKIMVGGAPVNRAYATKIGADGYAEDASRVIKEAMELL